MKRSTGAGRSSLIPVTQMTEKSRGKEKTNDSLAKYVNNDMEQWKVEEIAKKVQERQ